MTSSSRVKAKNRQIWRGPALLMASALGAVLAPEGASAAGARTVRAVESVQSRAAGEPVLAIVSLRSQRITVYDSKGWIMRAPVSSGERGRETPAGVFAILQKN